MGLAAVVLVVLAVVVGPWTYRNYRVTGAFVPVQTGAGMNFWLGNWPGYWTQRYDFVTRPPEVERLIKGKPEIVRERIFIRLGMEHIRHDPVRAAGIFLRKFGYLWLGALSADPRSCGNPVPHLGNFGVPKRSLVYVPVFVLAVLGLLKLDKTARRRAYPVLALLVAWTVPYVVICPVVRQMVPATYYEMILAAVGLRWMLLTRLRVKG